FRRLPCLVLSWLVRVPRCSSRYISPRQTGALAYSASAREKKSRGVLSSTFGDPSRSAVRCAAAIISRVGPPPPSPCPYGSSDRLAAPFSLYWREALASSYPEMTEL